MFQKNLSDICIIGAGIVGLSLANQIIERFPGLSVSILDKESKVGEHTSGRNSGVLHAGLYYEPESLKAKVCVDGAKRLKSWCAEEKLPIINCGKIITPQKLQLDSQLDLLLKRGIANGAKVELIDEKQFYKLAPDSYSSSGRALWSPETCVVNPLLIVNRLKKNLAKKGVIFHFFENNWKLNKEKNGIILSDKSTIEYDFIFNCAGLHSDRVAQKFGLGKEFTMLPFKGSYWQLKKDAPFKFDKNIYPVPDLEVPFLGVHITPGFGGKTYLGPTATPALGRENYEGLNKIESKGTIEFTYHMLNQMLIDKKMRNYIIDQALEWMPSKFLAAARSIIPNLSLDHIEKSSKVGIRPQLYNLKEKKLVQDFHIIENKKSSHIINAISPAFTASFAFADYIIDNSAFFNTGTKRKEK